MPVHCLMVHGLIGLPHDFCCFHRILFTDSGPRSCYRSSYQFICKLNMYFDQIIQNYCTWNYCMEWNLNCSPTVHKAQPSFKDKPRVKYHRRSSLFPIIDATMGSDHLKLKVIQVPPNYWKASEHGSRPIWTYGTPGGGCLNSPTSFPLSPFFHTLWTLGTS